MKRLCTLLLLLSPAVGLSGQVFTPEELAQANTAAQAGYLSESEREVVRYLNLARLNGPAFWAAYLAPRAADYTLGTYYQTLKTTLRATRGLAVLQPDSLLSHAAAYHAADMGASGGIGHTSSNGWAFDERLRALGVGTQTALAENCHYGYDDPLAIVVDLLVDEGVESLGHRENILGAEYRFVGVAIRPHRDYRVNCVMDFAGAQ